MATFKMGTKNVVSQSGTAEPAIASNVNIKDAFSALDSSATNGPTSGTAVTKSTTLPIFACRAWVNFNGNSVDGTNCAIRASGNVSSVVRTGTGQFTINFATDMPDTNYVMIGSSGNDGTTTNARAVSYNASNAVGSCSIRVTHTDSTTTNDVVVTVAFFR
mgnify:FL=1